MVEGESDLFTPTRLAILREVWTLLKEAKDLADAREKYKVLVTNTVLGENA